MHNRTATQNLYASASSPAKCLATCSVPFDPRAARATPGRYRRRHWRCADDGSGCRSLFPMEELSVMGLFEVLAHLPRLLRIRRAVVKHSSQIHPMCSLASMRRDFNLGVERRLKAAGIPTVHYVSPSVWAWRKRPGQDHCTQRRSHADAVSLRDGGLPGTPCAGPVV